MIQIEESGLTFGEFSEDDVFRIEKSDFIMNTQSIKSCEFVWLDNTKQLLWFVEARSTVPNPHKSRDKYDAFFDEIFEKIENSVISTAMGKLGKLKKVNAELSQSFLQLDWSLIKFKLILVIPGAPLEYLPNLSDKLRSMFTRQVKLWGVAKSDITVFNQTLAQKFGLLTD